MASKAQYCVCGHTIDDHIEQINGEAIAGECLRCNCMEYEEEVNYEN